MTEGCATCAFWERTCPECRRKEDLRSAADELRELYARVRELEGECLRLQEWDERRVHELRAAEERAERAEAALKRIYAYLEAQAKANDPKS